MSHRKFDLLMRLTKTSNTALGSVISIAPSYISKLRSGSRALPRNPVFLRPACDFLARRITSAEQAGHPHAPHCQWPALPLANS